MSNKNIHKTFPTEFKGGKAYIIKYDKEQNIYQSSSGLWWRMVDGVLYGWERK